MRELDNSMGVMPPKEVTDAVEEAPKNETIFLESDHRRGRTSGHERVGAFDYPEFESVELTREQSRNILVTPEDIDELLPID